MSEQDLVARLERVEAQARRLRKTLAGVLMAVLLAVVGWIAIGPVPAEAEGNDVADVVRAERFELIEEGKVRAVLDVFGSEPGLKLYDTDGTLRASLNVIGLLLYDTDETLRAILDVTETGSGLTLYDEDEKGRALLVVDESVSGLMLADANETFRAFLGVADPGPRLELLDEDKNVIWKAP